MVDFKARLAGKKAEKPVDPLALYETLDRAHDKGPLRPAQMDVLSQWFANHRDTRDVIVKLHTGQGKTLIGLLMLQSRLNMLAGSVVYLCPDNFLIAQTCEQARQFGIKTCISDGDLPEEFLNGTSIFVTSVQKLFNGITKFGLNRASIPVDTVLMDDAHACSDRIREQCRIRIPSSEPAYDALKTMFSTELELQGVGTFADIANDKRDALLPVPYWCWIEREGEVARILASQSDKKSIKFAWPLLKNMLAHCQCVISGAALEIEPYIAPLSMFGSYSEAKHRIFMSATVTDDAFLIKGLQLNPETVLNPLTYAKETWSGEKMVLLPSLMHPDLDRPQLVRAFGSNRPANRFGIVALAPGVNWTKDWQTYGAKIADKDTVAASIDQLKAKQFSQTLVLVNRYDGIDLPDETCRILVFDSKPYSESLIDLYQEYCRPESEATLMRTVRSVEQGMGRSVRGEKDYSVVIAIGADLVRLLRDKNSRRYLSPQMAAQIEIGLQIAEMARDDMENDSTPMQVLTDVINQCLKRDGDWKAFYAEQMDKIVPAGANAGILALYRAELDAEKAFADGDYSTAAAKLQSLLDSGATNSDDKGWYLQEMARYYYKVDRSQSNTLQVSAHKSNRLLLKPPSGVSVARLTLISQGRAERIAKWICGFGSYADLDVGISDILGRLVFGAKAEKFESALDELSLAIGFIGERPDKEWKEGPDNLWALDSTQYLLFECKSEVDINRSEINKRESEQMNRSSAWFQKHYPGCDIKRVIVHPSGKVESAAAFTHETEGMRDADLKKLVKSVREFFKSFENQNFKDLSVTHIQKMIDAHKLSVDDFLRGYSRKLRDLI